MFGELCINILDDDVLDRDETFRIRINEATMHPDIVAMDPKEAIVNLLDNECKHLNCEG